MKKGRAQQTSYRSAYLYIQVFIYLALPYFFFCHLSYLYKVYKNWLNRYYHLEECGLDNNLQTTTKMLLLRVMAARQAMLNIRLYFDQWFEGGLKR